MKLNVLVLVTVITGMFLFSVSNASAQTKSWQVPDKYVKMKNPTKADDNTLQTGKSVYDKSCASCHGKKGLGDGPKSAGLSSSCGDFSKADFQKQSDGEIFYKITNGRDEMPAFSKKITEDNNRWALVDYLRTLKK